MLTREHLPPITSELVVTTLYLEAEREIIGWHRCRDALVGNMRHKLGLIHDEQIVADKADRARDAARLLLKQLCRVCPHDQCNMKVQ